MATHSLSQCELGESSVLDTVTDYNQINRQIITENDKCYE